jgi:hypothetical protein
MNYLFVLAAFLCSLAALVVALGNSLGSSTWEEWVAGALAAYFLSLLVPWVEARRTP